MKKKTIQWLIDIGITLIDISILWKKDININGNSKQSDKTIKLHQFLYGFVIFDHYILNVGSLKKLQCKLQRQTK